MSGVRARTADERRAGAHSGCDQRGAALRAVAVAARARTARSSACRRCSPAPRNYGTFENTFHATPNAISAARPFVPYRAGARHHISKRHSTCEPRTGRGEAGPRLATLRVCARTTRVEPHVFRAFTKTKWPARCGAACGGAAHGAVWAGGGMGCWWAGHNAREGGEAQNGAHGDWGVSTPQTRRACAKNCHADHQGACCLARPGHQLTLWAYQSGAAGAQRREYAKRRSAAARSAGGGPSSWARGGRRVHQPHKSPMIYC